MELGHNRQVRNLHNCWPNIQESKAKEEEEEEKEKEQ
jgi:hypothetical protein